MGRRSSCIVALIATSICSHFKSRRVVVRMSWRVAVNCAVYCGISVGGHLMLDVVVVRVRVLLCRR